jgi:PilZ domain
MTTPPVGVERRIGQRFAFNLPVSLRDVSTAAEGLGFTQDLSSRGAFLFTDMALSEGAEIELTLRMPSEITLGDNMRVRCRGRVLRIVKASDNGWKPALAAETEIKPQIKPAEINPTEINPTEINPTETKSAETKSAETKIGLAVCLKGYEYLPETEDGSADFRRISALHSPSQTERPASPTPATPRAPAD